MRSSHKTSDLNRCLIAAGIQPASFAFFLAEYLDQKPRRLNPLSALLHKQLFAQAELIRYHLKK